MIVAKILLFLSCFQSADSVDQVKVDPIWKATDEVVFHDSLFTEPEVSIDLSTLKGWKLSTQDNPDFALKDYDDSQWYTLSNSLWETRQLPDSVWQGFGWLRLRIRIDSSFSKQLNVISPHMMGASEFYINGKFVLQHGVPGVTADKQELLGRILDLGTAYEFLPDSTYQLAVRYSLHHLNTLRHLSNGNFSQPVLLSIFLMNYEAMNIAIHRTIVTTTLYVFAAAILLMVLLLHLFMHLSVTDEKGNLAILVLSICLFLLSFSMISEGFTIRNFWLSIILTSTTGNIMVLMCCGLIPWVTHQVLGVPVHIFWKRFVFAPFLLVMLLAVFPEFPFMQLIAFIVVLLIVLSATGSILAMIKARKIKKSGIGLIVGSLMAYPILFIITIIMGINGVAYFWTSMMFFLMLISMPVGMSIHQAKQFLTLHLHLDSLVKDRTAELNKSLNDLKATQSQLIQSEKMASLGELTAGIAHEIQNPLNFVNNFSEINTELIDELKKELARLSDGQAVGSKQSAEELIDDIQANEEKINHHGKRADAIVKGMLQHSRSSSGVKEPTDINALADEYLRLAYHGLRAKDKSFNATMKTDFDESIGNINIIPQDIGRVILNLITNAFYVVNERLRQTHPDSGYEPTVVVSSRKEGNKVLLSVKDNGNGIPDSIKEKIFQPFFTTKPTGQGTGLGLSLSYDIVKAHKGEMKVASKLGEETIFTIFLPND